MNHRKIQKAFYKQQEETDCGVACLLSIIRFYEGEGRLENLRRLSGTNTVGTTLLGLYQAANNSGFEATGCEGNISELKKQERPLILHALIKEQLEHYVVCYGFDKEKNQFLIGDPAQGVSYYSEKELEKIWVSKTCLTLSPKKKFEKAKQLKTKKWKWFLGLLKDDYNLLVYSLLIGIMVAILGMTMAIFSQKLIDNILPSKDLTKLIGGLFLITFLLLARVFLSTLRGYLLIHQTKDFNNRIVDQFYRNLLYLPKPFFDTRKIGELTARLNDTSRIQGVVQHISGNFLIELLVTLISIVFLFIYSWQTGLIALFSMPVYFFIIYRFNHTIIKQQREVMQNYAFTESNYINTLQGISTIKNHNKQNFFQKINQIIYKTFQQKVFDLGKINIRLSLYGGLSGVLFTAIILSYCSYSAFYDRITLGELMLILTVAGSLLPSVSSLAMVAIPLNEAKIAFDRMYEYSAIEKENTTGEPLTSFESLSVNNITFRFPGRQALLNNLSFKIEKGKIVAVIGESGCGKSTLSQILQKFYQCESGDIQINNHYPLKQIDTQGWRKQLGVVSQEIHFFNGSVIDNIALEEKTNPQEVIKFCQERGFEPFISKFPQNYLTLLGERGVNLSGGQKQVLALARALYKKPQLIILDEPTAAMDRITERFVLQLLNDIKEQTAVLIISHRLHTLKNLADEICIIEDKTIKNKGTHQELLETENFYSDFYSF